MIESKDLRIGNKVLYGKSKSLHSIKANDFTHVVDCPELYQPIALSPEILEKCGFEDYFGGFYKHKETGYGIDHSFTNNTFKIVGNNKTIYLNFLHELQNAFYMQEKQDLVISL